MREISLHILDIVQNSIAVKAKNVFISVEINPERDTLKITVKDDGPGMEADFLKEVADPFTTTRKTGKVGMGLPLYKQAAEVTGGSFEIASEKGKGTVVTAVFIISIIDRVPMGDLAETVITLIQNAATTDIIFSYYKGAEGFTLDTR
jgi:signal transduction histidine kinase